MMTAMARLPCNNKQACSSATGSPSSQQQQQQQQQHNSRYAVASAVVSPNHPTYAQSRSYWEAQQLLGQQHLQQQQQQQQQQQHQHNSLPSFTRSHHRHHSDTVGKRKSAVELLQESKAFYVKSETVLDRKQELKNSGHLQVSQLSSPSAPLRLLRKCGPGLAQIHPNSQPTQPTQHQQLNQIVSPPCCWATCHDTDRPLPPKSPRLVPVPQRRSGPAGGGQAAPGSEQLQAKLRRLLNCADSKENVFFPDVVNGEVVPAPPAEYATPSPVLANGAAQTPGPLRYSPGGSLSPGYRDDERTWSATMGSDVRHKFGRSNSHSHGVRGGPTGTMARPGSGGRDVSRSPGVYDSTGSVNDAAVASVPGGYCHKSLPDLHASTARRRASLSPRASTKSSSRRGGLASTGCPDCETGSDFSDKSFSRDNLCYRSDNKRPSSRHLRRSVGSGGGDASSVLSSGGRTQKSSGSSKLSHGANARDSGGSSGHCTHRSEPPPRIQDCWSQVQRRDSGASTQHSNERGGVGDRSRRSSGANYSSTGVVGTAGGAVVAQRYGSNHGDDDDVNTNSSNSQTGEDYSPTRNSRFSDGWKESRNRPILRSKSDISDRYWRHADGSSTMASLRPGSKHSTNPRAPRSMSQLESFFDRMGLDADSYQHITEPSSRGSSPVFEFDSVSSVDSALGLYSNWANGCPQNQWLNGGAANNNQEESPATGAQRSGDPPSIVERNARIIKWLCQCRKMQFGYS